MNIVPANVAADFRSVLEDGNILFFPDGGFPLPESIRGALLGATQDSRSFHKNIAYKTNVDRVSGLADKADAFRVQPIMRDYSRLALDFCRRILPQYASSWKVDYASFRSIEERGRDLPLTKRNDLLHVDAFPTRPTFGDLILRCFTNINPTQHREWLTGDPFALLAPREAEKAGLSRFTSSPQVLRAARRALSALGVPVVDRSPYDAFMLHFHDWLKANRDYQENSPKYRFDLPPNSTWLVFTDVVPHAVLGGQYALEQTLIVARKSLADRSKAPASILEKLCGRDLTR